MTDKTQDTKPRYLWLYEELQAYRANESKVAKLNQLDALNAWARALVSDDREAADPTTGIEDPSVLARHVELIRVDVGNCAQRRIVFDMVYRMIGDDGELQGWRTCSVNLEASFVGVEFSVENAGRLSTKEFARRLARRLALVLKEKSGPLPISYNATEK